jgi:hypothetical protein
MSEASTLCIRRQSSALLRVLLSLRLAYLEYRHSQDSEGFTLLYRLVLRSNLDVFYSAVGMIFTR